MVIGQWIVFAIVFIIVFFFIWYTARFIITGLFAVASLLLIVYVLNEMQLVPEPLKKYADLLFRKETVEQVKSSITEYVRPQPEQENVPAEK